MRTQILTYMRESSLALDFDCKATKTLVGASRLGHCNDCWSDLKGRCSDCYKFLAIAKDCVILSQRVSLSPSSEVLPAHTPSAGVARLAYVRGGLSLLQQCGRTHWMYGL